jgi:peroxiredoxin
MAIGGSATFWDFCVGESCILRAVTSSRYFSLFPSLFSFYPRSSMPLPIGTSAPDFTLKTKTAAGLEDVTLSDNFGKQNTVLLFFPLAFTGVCTAEMCDISGGIAAYESLNAAVYGISIDSPFAHEAWAKQEKITLKLLSDLNKTVIKAYDVVFPNIAGVGDSAARAAFVIDKQGTIVYDEQTPTRGICGRSVRFTAFFVIRF